MAGGGRVGADPRTPTAELYAPNLTPDEETGIGLWAEPDSEVHVGEAVFGVADVGMDEPINFRAGEGVE